MSQVITAIHEAGHAIAHVRFGIEQHIASIVPNYTDGTAGHVSADEGAYSKTDAENQAIAFYSGYAALIVSEYPESFATLGCDSDFALAGEIIEAWQLRPIEQIKEEAIKLMSSPANIKAIRLVSEALMEHQKISGNYVDILASFADGEISEEELARYRSLSQIYWLE